MEEKLAGVFRERRRELKCEHLRRQGGLGVSAPAIFTSPLTRAVETAGILAEETGARRPEETDILEPGAAPEELLEMAKELVSWERVIFVGHQPDLGCFASVLLWGQPGRSFGIGAGAVLAIRLEVVERGGGSLEFVLDPEDPGLV